MAMTTGQHADSLDPGFRTIFHDDEPAKPAVMSRLFNESTTDLLTVKESSVSGFGQVPQKTQGQAATVDQRYQGYNASYTQLFYSMAAEVTREMLDFDRGGSMKTIPTAMSAAVKATLETMAANHFNRHITSGYTGPDGSLLCVTNHAARAGSAATHGNLGTAGSLTHTTLADGRLNMNKTKGVRQEPMETKPNYLQVPPDLEEKALIITGSDRKSGTANWDVNIFKGGGLEIVVNNYITITTGYWLISKNNKLQWIWSAKPEFNRDKGVSEQIAKWYVYFRCVSGWTDWRGVWGNNGA